MPVRQEKSESCTHSRNAIVAYPTPKAPFSVWQIDLYGPLRCTPRSNSYIFKHNSYILCMFSMLMYAVPIRNKDAVTVLEALFFSFSLPLGVATVFYLTEFMFVLRFYGPVNPMGSCRARSVYLTTRLLGRLSPLSG